MKIKFKFNSAFRSPIDPDHRQVWLLGAVAVRVIREVNTVWEFELLWKRLGVLAFAMFVTGYLALATALYFWWARIPNNVVQWSDVVSAPLHPEQLQAKRGDTAVQNGLDALLRREYFDAFYNLSLGVMRSPRNTEGRLALVKMLTGARPAQALKLMEEGLPYESDNLQYFRTLMALQTLQGNNQRALEQIAGLLAPERQPALSDEVRQMLLLARVAFLKHAKSYQEMGVQAGRLHEVAWREDKQKTLAWQLQIEALFHLQKTREVQELLDSEFGQKLPLPVRQKTLAEIAIAKQDEAGLRAALPRLIESSEDKPGAYLYTIQAWGRMDRPSLQAEAEQDFLYAFASDEAILQRWAALAAALDLEDSLLRLANVAEQNGHNRFAFRVNMTDAALRAGKFDQALRYLWLWENSVELLKPDQQFHPELVKRLTRTCVADGEKSGALLLSHLGSSGARASVASYLFSMEVVGKSGNRELAREIVRLGLRIYPYCDELRVEAKRQAEEDAAEAKRLVEASARAEALKLQAKEELPTSVAAALAQVDRLLAAGSYREVGHLLAKIREHQPVWLAMAQEPMDFRELEYQVMTEPALNVGPILTSYLGRHSDEKAALEVVELARKLIERRNVAEARLLHDEVRRVRGEMPRVALALQGLNLPDELAQYAATEAAALARLDKLQAAGQPTLSLQLFEYLQERRPEWLPQARMELALREVPIRLALDQRLLALLAFKELVDRSGQPRAMAFKLVRDLGASGNYAWAMMLAMEAKRILPNDPAAEKLRLQISLLSQ